MALVNHLGFSARLHTKTTDRFEIFRPDLVELSCRSARRQAHIEVRKEVIRVADGFEMRLGGWGWCIRCFELLFRSGRRRKLTFIPCWRDISGFVNAALLLDLFTDVKASQHVRDAIAGAKPAGAHLKHPLLVAIPSAAIVLFMPGVVFVFRLYLLPDYPKARHAWRHLRKTYA